MAFTNNFEFYDLLALEDLDLKPHSLIALHLSQLLNLVNFSGLVQGDCCAQPPIDNQIKYEICIILQLLNVNLSDDILKDDTLDEFESNCIIKSRKSIFIFKFIAILIQYYAIVQGDCIKGAFVKNIILSLFSFNTALILEITNEILNCMQNATI